MFQLIDPVTGVNHPAQGSDGKIITCLPPDGSAVTPDNLTVYDPPIIISVWDATPKTVVVVPYGRGGDVSVSYPTKPGMKVPVLVKQVLSGTTAAQLRGQLAYIAGTLTLGVMLAESGGLILTEGSEAIILESGT